MLKIKGLLISMLLFAGILAGCNETPAENKDSTTEAVNVDATDWPRTFKDALGKEIVIEEKPEKNGFTMVFLP